MGKIAWIFFLVTGFATIPAFAADSTDKALDTNKTHQFGDIDIFGQSAIGSIFVLWDNIDIILEVKKSIQEKSFATDEFYMQNIDREQFEEERILKLFEGERTQYFKLFPGALEDEDEEDDED